MCTPFLHAQFVMFSSGMVLWAGGRTRLQTTRLNQWMWALRRTLCRATCWEGVSGWPTDGQILALALSRKQERTNFKLKIRFSWLRCVSYMVRNSAYARILFWFSWNFFTLVIIFSPRKSKLTPEVWALVKSHHPAINCDAKIVDSVGCYFSRWSNPDTIKTWDISLNHYFLLRNLWHSVV